MQSFQDMQKKAFDKIHHHLQKKKKKEVNFLKLD